MNNNDNETPKTSINIKIISYIVSIIALVVIFLTLAETNFLVFSDYKASFIVLWIIGLSMSVLAGIRDNPDGEFTMQKFVMIPLMTLGFITLPLLIVVFFEISIPFLQAKELFIGLATIIILKWVMVHTYNFMKHDQSEKIMTQ
ncbi:MAG: hypothetical protein ACW981_20945 [Candidatus Hodarchaeales archaeon]|jgi:CDP-diglyceride synthetase